MISLSFLVVFACSNPDETYTTAPGLHADMPTRELLTEWMAWRDISRGELERRLTVSESAVQRAGGKVGQRGIDLIRVASYCPALFYADGERVVLVYIDDNKALARFKPDELTALFPPQAALKSRAYGTDSHYVNASAGIAWTTYSETVEALELFHPTTVEQYKADFYVEPEPLPDDVGPHAR
jgi:hypothetical protein